MQGVHLSASADSRRDCGQPRWDAAATGCWLPRPSGSRKRFGGKPHLRSRQGKRPDTTSTSGAVGSRGDDEGVTSSRRPNRRKPSEGHGLPVRRRRVTQRQKNRQLPTTPHPYIPRFILCDGGDDFICAISDSGASAPLCLGVFGMQTQSRGLPRHPELSVISLVRSVASDDGVLPVGATGTVVHVYPGERAYEVEFFQPFHTVATVEASALGE